MESKDAINPDHYQDGGIQVIDFIEAKKLNFNTGNAVKYIARAGKKDPSKHLEDLRKSKWYIEREIALVERTAAAVTTAPRAIVMNVETPVFAAASPVETVDVPKVAETKVEEIKPPATSSLLGGL